MREPRRTYDRDGPRNLSPGLRNSLETEDDMMGVSVIGICLGLALVGLIIVVLVQL